MDIRYLGKKLAVTQGMKDHLSEKLAKLEKYSPRLVASHVVLKKEKYLFAAEITLLARHLRAYGEGASKENVYTAIDQAYERIEKQLKKYREKVKDHYKEHGEQALPPKVKTAQRAGKAAPPVPAAERPRIVRSSSFAAKPMSIEEASLQLELSPETFLVFRNAGTQEVNVIFKRQDGRHGWIEPAL